MNATDDTFEYEPPSLTVVGSLHELTLGEGVQGDADSFTFTSDWGYEITAEFGRS